MNRFIFTGYVADNPALVYNNTIINFTLEIQKKNRKGEYIIDDFRCAVYGENVKRFMDKKIQIGDMIAGEGEMRSKTYTDLDGIEKRQVYVNVSYIERIKHARDVELPGRSYTGYDRDRD